MPKAIKKYENGGEIILPRKVISASGGPPRISCPEGYELRGGKCVVKPKTQPFIPEVFDRAYAHISSEEDKELAKKDIERFRPVVEWFGDYVKSPYYNKLIGEYTESKGEILDEGVGAKLKPIEKNLLDVTTKNQIYYSENYPYMNASVADENKRFSIFPHTVAQYIAYPGGGRRIAISSRNIDDLNRYKKMGFYGPGLAKQGGVGDPEGVMAHELGHAEILGSAVAVPGVGEGDIKPPSFRFENWVRKNNKYWTGEADTEGMSESWIAHQKDVKETRADMIRFRYNLETKGVFKSTGEFKEFTEKDYEKAIKEDPNNRIFKKYDKEGVIFLMNNMADAGDPSDLNIDDMPQGDVKTASKGMKIVKRKIKNA